MFGRTTVPLLRKQTNPDDSHILLYNAFDAPKANSGSSCKSSFKFCGELVKERVIVLLRVFFHIFEQVRKIAVLKEPAAGILNLAVQPFDIVLIPIPVEIVVVTLNFSR